MERRDQAAATPSPTETIRTALQGAMVGAWGRENALRALGELESILDDLCDWAQHVAAPENDGIHFIVERAAAALKGERDA